MIGESPTILCSRIHDTRFPEPWNVLNVFIGINFRSGSRVKDNRIITATHFGSDIIPLIVFSWGTKNFRNLKTFEIWGFLTTSSSKNRLQDFENKRDVFFLNSAGCNGERENEILYAKYMWIGKLFSSKQCENALYTLIQLTVELTLLLQMYSNKKLLS